MCFSWSHPDTCARPNPSFAVFSCRSCLLPRRSCPSCFSSGSSLILFCFYFLEELSAARGSVELPLDSLLYRSQFWRSIIFFFLLTFHSRLVLKLRCILPHS